MEIEKYFEVLRFNDTHHLGLGDIRLTVAQQEEIIFMVNDKESVKVTKEKMRGISQFDQVLKERLRKIEEILGKKAEEYARNNDRYHNFNVAARIGNTTPEKALLGMMMKHIVSVIDLIEDPKSATFELIDEKIGDQINYLILLEGMMKKEWDIYDKQHIMNEELSPTTSWEIMKNCLLQPVGE